MLVRISLQPSRSRSSRLSAVGLSACLLATSAPAIAAPAEGEDEAQDQPIDTEARAMKAYRDGQQAYADGDYGKALELFLEAQSLYPSPDFHYNIAKCHEALENYEQAALSYKAYLRSYTSAYGADPDDKANIENKIERLEKQIEAEQAAAEAERNKKPDVIIQTIETERAPKPGVALMIAGGVLAGVGVGVAGVGGGVFGAAAARYDDELEDVYENGNPGRVTLEQARQIDADGRAAELNQILTLTIGSVVAVTGVALLAVGVVKKRQGESERTPTISPAIGPAGAGLLIRGRF